MEGGGGIRAARRVAIVAAGRLHHPGHDHLACDQRIPGAGSRLCRGQFDAVSLPISAPEALSVSAKSSIKTLADLVKEAKAGKVFMGSAGIGTGSHIAAEYFFKVLAKTPGETHPVPGRQPGDDGLCCPAT